MQTRLVILIMLAACGGGGGTATVDGGGSGSGSGDGGGSGSGSDIDANTNVCTPACGTEANAGVECDVYHACDSTCDDGFTRCGDACTAESPTSCGVACTACPTPAHGSPTCSGGVCGMTCDTGYTQCLSGLSYACCAYASDIVAPQEFGGYTTSLAIDAHGHQHVVFNAAWQEQMTYATDASGAWTFEQVTPYWSSGGGAQFVAGLGEHGPVVMYSYPNGSSSLFFAERRTAGWSYAPLLPELPSGFAMASDRAGRVHACFTSSSSHTGVRYGIRSGDVWTITQISDDPEARGACAIAVDQATGLAHIIYYKSDAQDVAYLGETAPGTFGAVQTVDSAGTVGSELAIAVAPDGTPHVAASRTDTSVLRHGELHGGTWTVENVTANFDGDSPAIAVDATGVPMITAFVRGSYYRVVILQKTGTWALHVFDDVSNANGAIAVGPDSVVHVATGDRDIVDHVRGAGTQWFDLPIAHDDAADGPIAMLRNAPTDVPVFVYTRMRSPEGNSVEIARKSGSGWATSDVADAAPYGAYPAAALDASGKVHVAYTAANGLDLVYAVEGAAGFGASEPLATGAHDVALAIDGTGVVHAMYVTTANVLMHATRGASSWTATMVATGAHYQAPVMRIDGANVVHVLWYDPTAKKTIYASSADAYTQATVEATAATGHDLYVTAAGVPYACWLKPNGGYYDLKYGNKTGAAWSATTIAPPGSDVNDDVCALALDAGGTVAIARSLRYGAGFGALEVTVLGASNVSTLVHDDFYSGSLAISAGAAGFEIGSRGVNYSGSSDNPERLRWSHK